MDRRPARFDFISEHVTTDGASTVLRLVPDPRRYSELMIEGKLHYLDRFLHVAIPADELRKASEPVPMYAPPTTVRSTNEYATERREALRAELTGAEYRAPSQAAYSHRTLDYETTTKGVSFISIDVCGSSALRSANHTAFEQAYRIMLRELGTAVGQFGCSILKTTGDGFIAFNDFPGFTTQCDTTADLATSLLVILENSINPALETAGLQPLHVRIGADYGQASVRKVLVPATGYATTEIASDALNRAVKIEQSAAVDEVRIGRDLYELLHVGWLQRCSEVAFEGSDVGQQDYKVYAVK